MVSDSELVERLREFLRASDLTTTTTASVRRQLESDFGVDLSEKKQFIREQVDLFLSCQFDQEGPHEGDTNEEGNTEEDVKQEEEEEGEEVEGNTVEIDEEEKKEEEAEEEDENASAGGSRKRRLDKANKEGKRKGGGFTKLCSLSPELQKFVGASELARTEVVKKLWEYIRANDMQDPNNKRKIICDERFKKLFDVDSIDMFQMNKALTKHIWPLDSESGAGPVTPESSKPKDKPHNKDRNDGKRQKGGSSGSSGSSGLLVPLQLSDDLVEFFGTGESMLSRSDVVKRMWEYIKQNNLQDPSDRRKILCDEKLKDLFKLDTFTGFTVSKLLSPHFIKTK